MGDARWDDVEYLKRLAQSLEEFDAALQTFIGMHTVTAKPLMGVSQSLPALMPIRSMRAETVAQHRVVSRAAGRAGSATELTNGYKFVAGIGRIDPIDKWETLLSPKPSLSLEQVTGAVAKMLGAVEDRVTQLESARTLVRATHTPTIEKRDAAVPTKDKAPRPRVFIGSSAEKIDLAETAQALIDYDYEGVPWHRGVFGPGSTTIAALAKQAEKFDFAIFIVDADDVTIQREKETHTARDNVVFEMGLFMGALGHDRVFMVYNRDNPPDLASDLDGVTAAKYAPHRDGNLDAAMTPALREIKKVMKELGPLR